MEAKGAEGMNLRRHFALLSFVLIALWAVFFIWGVGQGYMAGLLGEAKESMVRLIQEIAATHLAGRDLQTPAEGKAYDQMYDLLERALLDPDIVRLRLFNRAGVVVYSDRRPLVGRKLGGIDAKLERALHNEVVVYIGMPSRLERESEGLPDEYLMNLYIPLDLDRNGSVDAVFGIDQTIKPLQLRMVSSKRVLAWLLLGGLAALWLALYGVVHNAARRMARTQAQLEAGYRERQQLTERLFQSEKLLSLGRLSTGIAHEINNPMCGILSFIKLVQQEAQALQASESILRKLEIIHQQASRIRRITERVLAFSRAEEAPSKTVDVRAPLEQTLALVRHDFECKGIAVEEHLGEVPLWVRSSADSLQEVFMNLFLNAQEAMPQGGILAVQARREDGWARLEVRDTGQGIPPEHLARVFEPGFSTKNEGGVAKGLGLGLFLSAHTIESYNGRIELASEVNKGTTVTIHLPLEEASENAPTPDSGH